MILILTSPETKFWGGVVALLVGGLAYLAFKLSKGRTGGYMKAEISDGLKATLIFIHGLGSLVLALIIPNNFLADIGFIGELYQQSGLWIAASILTLLFIFLVAIGTTLTLLTKNRIKG